MKGLTGPNMIEHQKVDKSNASATIEAHHLREKYMNFVAMIATWVTGTIVGISFWSGFWKAFSR